MSYSWSYDGLLVDDVPDIYLNEINRNAIGILNKRFISDFNISMKLINISTVSFKYNINYRTPPSLYNEIKNGRCFEIIGFGWFVITSSEIVNNEEEIYVDITAESFQTVLQEKKLYNIGTINTDDSYDLYILYNDNDPTHSILHRVIDKNPKWRIGFIDPEIKNSYRTFNVSETSSYDLLVNSAAEAYECYFVFDFNNRTINAYKAHNIGEHTDIYISLKNVISEYGLKENRSEMATRIDVYGGDDCGNGNLNIISVNPSGTNYLINIDYFKDRMSDTIKNKLETYTKLLEDNREKYYKLASSLYDLYNQLHTLSTYVSTDLTNLSLYGLNQLESLYESKNVILSTLTSGSNSSKYSACYNEIKTIEIHIKNKKAEIKAKEEEIERTLSDIKNYQKMLDIKNTFTVDELKDLEDFMIDGSYTNENYVCKETMTQAEKLNMQLELLSDANEYLEEVSHPKYELTLTTENFIRILGNSNRNKQFKLGNIINIDLDESLSGRKNSFLQLKLIEVEKSYTDSGVDVKLVFSSSLKLIGGEIAYDDLLGSIESTNKYLSYNSSTISRAYGIVNSTSNFLKADFNATLNKLKESDKQQFLLDGTGAKLKRLIGDNTYSPNQMWLTNNGMYLTTDNFETINCAIGEIVDGKGNITYGIAADIIMGRLFVGEKLKLSGSGAELDLTANQSIVDVKGNLSDLEAEFKVNIEGLKAEFTKTISNYSTTEQTKSLIESSAGSIKLTVNGTQTTLDKAMQSTTATLELKINKDDGGGMISAINASADIISIDGKKINISGNTTFSSVASTAESAYSTANSAYSYASSASSSASTAQATIDQYKKALQNGTTTINGGCIDTGSLSADFITTAARGTGWIICKNVSDDGANYIYGVGSDFSGSENLVLKTGGDVAFACGMTGYYVGQNTSNAGAKVQIFHNGRIRCNTLEVSSFSPSSLSVTNSLTLGGYSVLSTYNYSSTLNSVYQPKGTYLTSIPSTRSIYADMGSANCTQFSNTTVAGKDWVTSNFEPLSSSDMRLKYDFETIEDVKDFYMKLKPYSYRFKDSNVDDKKHHGVVAQELISNLQEHGIDYEDSGFIEKYQVRDYYDEGMYVPDKIAYRVNYNEFHAYHIKMIQILTCEIENLKTEIQLLKS